MGLEAGRRCLFRRIIIIIIEAGRRCLFRRIIIIIIEAGRRCLFRRMSVHIAAHAYPNVCTNFYT